MIIRAIEVFLIFKLVALLLLEFLILKVFLLAFPFFHFFISLLKFSDALAIPEVCVASQILQVY